MQHWAVSILKGNTAVQVSDLLRHYFGRRVKNQGFSGSIVHRIGYLGQVLLGVLRHIRPLGKALPEQVVGIFIGRALPRVGGRIGKVDP